LLFFLPENHPAGFDFKLDVTGTKGVLSLDMLKQGIEFYSIQSTKYPPMIAPLIEEDKQFIKSILDDKEVPVTGLDGIMATKMALAAMESIETHKSIEITY